MLGFLWHILQFFFFLLKYHKRQEQLHYDIAYKAFIWFQLEKKIFLAHGYQKVFDLAAFIMGIGLEVRLES